MDATYDMILSDFDAMQMLNLNYDDFLFMEKC